MERFSPFGFSSRKVWSFTFVFRPSGIWLEGANEARISRVDPRTRSPAHRHRHSGPSRPSCLCSGTQLGSLRPAHLEKEMATHVSVLAWRIPGTGEPGGLPSLGSHRVRHNRSDLAAATGLPTTLKALRGSRSPFLPLPGQTPPSRKPIERRAGPTFATWWRARRPARGGDGSAGG